MSLLWFAPAAFAGLLLLAGPILLHLLTRHEQRTVPFPTLRFLSTSTRVARAHRAIDDWPLLLLRLGVLVAAVLAVAAPLLTTWRQKQWAGRVTRAVVLLPGAEAPQMPGAFRSASFTAGEHAEDALAAATDWLGRQPPARREIVIVGYPRRAQLTGADIAAVPTHVGLTFDSQAPSAVPPRFSAPLLTSAAAEVRFGQAEIVAEPNATAVAWQTGLKAPADIAVTVRAVPAEHAAAENALRSALRRGLVSDPDRPRRAVVAWRGANVEALMPVPLGSAPALLAGEPLPTWVEGLARTVAHPVHWVSQTALVQVDAQVKEPAASALVEAVAAAVSANSLRGREPEAISEGEIEAWSRPSSGVDREAPLENEGDARWLWAAALLLLATEQLVRRRPRSTVGGFAGPPLASRSGPDHAAFTAGEVRVA